MIKNRFSFNKIKYFLLLIPFFKTDFIARFYLLNSIFNFWKLGSIIFVFFLIILNRKFSKSYFTMLLFCLLPIITTFITSGNISMAFNLYGGILAISYLFEKDGDKLPFLETLLVCFEIVIYINFITMIFYPNGLYSTGNVMIGTAFDNWFLGYKNTMVVYFLPAFILSYILKNLTGKKLSFILLSVVITISIVLSRSSTTLVGGFIMLVFTIFKRLRNKISIFNLKNYLIFSFLLFFLIVIFRFQNIFSFFIVDILHKDLTFTNRTYLWDVTLTHILNKPIFGHGVSINIVRNLMYNSSTIISAHNQILEYFYIGGLIEVLLFIFLILIAVKNCKKYYNDKNVQIISFGFFVFQILNLTEVYFNPIIYITVIFTLYSFKYLVINKDKDFIQS